MYDLANTFFLDHQPAFMVAMLVGFCAICAGLAIWDERRVARLNQPRRRR